MLPKDINKVIAREYETDSFRIIELSPTPVNHGNSIEVVTDGFSVTHDIPMDSGTFPAIEGETKEATICLLFVKGKDMAGAVREIRSLGLVPEDFPILDAIKRMENSLRGRGVEIVVCLGKRSVYRYEDETTGHIGFDLEHRHFGMYYSDFGACEGMWFAFSKKALLQLISHL